MHIYGKDQQAFHLTRTRVEKYFSRLNAIIVAMQLACWLCSIIRVALNAANSMSNSLFATTNLSLNAAFTAPGCVYNVTRTHAFFDNVTYQLSPETVGYFVSRSVMNLRYLWALTGMYTVVSIINRLFFETNTHELRYHFTIFRKDTLTTWELLLLVLGLVMTFGVTEENRILQDYLVYCSGQGLLPPQYYNSVLPFVELYVMYFISLGFFVVNALVAFWNLSKENPRDALLKEDARKRAEWEELVRKYQQPTLPNTDPSHNNTPLHAPPLPPAQQVTYAGNVAPVGDAPPPHDNSPPPALRRPQSPQPRPGPPAPPPPAPPPAAAASPLYANRLPDRPKNESSRGTSGQQPSPIHERRPVSPPLESGPGDNSHNDPRHNVSAQNTLNTSEAEMNKAAAGGGRYDLREVYDDDPVKVADPSLSSVEESLSQGGGGGSNSAGSSGVGIAMRQRQPQMPAPSFSRPSDSIAASRLSTPILATRDAVIPPPPPVAVASDKRSGTDGSRTGGGNGGGGHRPSVSKMLAPPSPPNNGNDTTTDTVHLGP